MFCFRPVESWKPTLLLCLILLFSPFSPMGCLEEGGDGDGDADGDGDGDGDVTLPPGACELSEDVVERPSLPERPAAVDYLILTANHLENAAQEHADWRDERGHRSEVLTMSQALDDGSGGVIDDRTEALETLRAIIAERREELEDGRELFVLLLGDVNRNWDGQVMEVPVDEVGGWQWGDISDVTSDNTIADLDGDDIPDVALGRIPAQRNEQAQAILQRTRDLESGYIVGAWNHDVHVFASEAGFGEVVDSLIEQAGFAAVREVPNDWRLSFTYARPGSPYAYPPAHFSDRIYELLNAGSVLTAYIGHGYEEGFDDVVWDSEREPIFDTADLDQLDMSNRSSVLMLSACLTGAFDTGTSLAEQFLNAEGGPVAVIASTEVSHPFGNGVLIRELAMTMLSQRLPTVGEAFLEAKRRMFSAADDAVRVEIVSFTSIDPSSASPELREDLLRAHEHMYALVGDPAHVIAYPAGQAEIILDADAVQAGEPIEGCVQIHGPASGHAVVTLSTARETIGYNLESWEMDDSDRDEVVMANYELANDKDFEELEGTYAGGGFSFSLPTSSEHTGELTIRVYASEGGLDAIGSTTVRVNRVQE